MQIIYLVAGGKAGSPSIKDGLEVMRMVDFIYTNNK